MVRNLSAWRNGNVVPFEDLYKEMDSLVGGLLSGNEGRRANGFSPRINVAETESEFEITVDLPGVNPDEVSVELHEGQLTISGQRASEDETDGKTFHRVERVTGEFRRTISVDVPVDEEKISAEYTHGVLRVVLPKSEKLRPKKIEVRTAERSN